MTGGCRSQRHPIEAVGTDAKSGELLRLGTDFGGRQPDVRFVGLISDLAWSIDIRLRRDDVSKMLRETDLFRFASQLKEDVIPSYGSALKAPHDFPATCAADTADGVTEDREYRGRFRPVMAGAPPDQRDSDSIQPAEEEIMSDVASNWSSSAGSGSQPTALGDQCHARLTFFSIGKDLIPRAMVPAYAAWRRPATIGEP